MTLWRVLTHGQAETEYERVELQLLQLEGALSYLDRAWTAGDTEWTRRALHVASQVAAQTGTRMAALSATSSQHRRYCSALTLLRQHVHEHRTGVQHAASLNAG